MLPSLVTFLAAVAAALAPTHLPPGFRVVTHGPAGGQIWRGAIAGARRASMIYVPPDYSSGRRYPVIYLLAGMPGSPWSYVRSLSLASVKGGGAVRRRRATGGAERPLLRRVGGTVGAL